VVELAAGGKTDNIYYRRFPSSEAAVVDVWTVVDGCLISRATVIYDSKNEEEGEEGGKQEDKGSFHVHQDKEESEEEGPVVVEEEQPAIVKPKRSFFRVEKLPEIKLTRDNEEDDDEDGQEKRSQTPPQPKKSVRRLSSLDKNDLEMVKKESEESIANFVKATKRNSVAINEEESGERKEVCQSKRRVRLSRQVTCDDDEDDDEDDQGEADEDQEGKDNEAFEYEDKKLYVI